MRKFIVVVLIILCGLFSINLKAINSFSNDYQANAYAIPKQPYDKKPTETTPYNGKIYHIFFHSLILYPELAYKSSRASGYRDWMVTRNEFLGILNKLYKNGFVLADINYVRQTKLSNKPLMFPKNKKLLILSIDDVNYYEYMKNDGFAEKLIVDNNGRLATYVRDLSGKRIIDYQGDVMPIVNNFIEKHPDFSFNGAKGIVAVTGYQGVFGYRINTLQGEELSQALIEAKNVANTLKSTGWSIACHSYSHSNSFKDGSIGYERLKTDTHKWNSIVAPVTGKTNIYISPFGIQFSPTDSRLKFLIANGFNVFCPVYKKMNVSFEESCMISQRLNIDGFTFRRYPERISSEFFEIDSIDEN